MSRPLSDDGLQRLGQAATARDRVRYYTSLKSETADPYADLALGVVTQLDISGIVARRFAIEVGRRYCRTIDEPTWIAISEALMLADLAARRSDIARATGELPWNVIRDYHVAIFGQRDFGLPPFAWIAWVPLEVQRDDDKRASTWRRMLTENIMEVSLQTVGKVIGTLPHVWKLWGAMDVVIPTLHLHPPLATGAAGSPEFQACMAEMTGFQLGHNSMLSRDQHLALFYLDVLSTNGAIVGSGLREAPFSAWRSVTDQGTGVRIPSQPDLVVTPGSD